MFAEPEPAGWTCPDAMLTSSMCCQRQSPGALYESTLLGHRAAAPKTAARDQRQECNTGTCLVTHMIHPSSESAVIMLHTSCARHSPSTCTTQQEPSAMSNHRQQPQVLKPGIPLLTPCYILPTFCMAAEHLSEQQPIWMGRSSVHADRSARLEQLSPSCLLMPAMTSAMSLTARQQQ